MDPFSRLGDFEIAHLVEFLDPIDIILLQRVSKLWRGVLNSSYVSRIALLHHFPYVSQSRDLRDSHSMGRVPVGDVTLLWRRVVYQYHTRRMGQPTRMHQVLLDYTDSLLEWDVAEGRAAWISNERDDKVLRVKSLEGGDEGALKEIELAGEWLEDDERGITGALRVVTLKIVKGLAILSLEYPTGWNGCLHPPYSGNRAKFIVVDLKDSTSTVLWKYRMHPQQTILGEVEWSEDKLYYLRRTPIRQFGGLDKSSRSLVHFVIHDMFTGSIIQEISVENGNSLVPYKRLMYDVMVVDRPLKHFILVRDEHGSPWRMDLMATVYTLAGKVVGKFRISPEPVLSPDGNITRNIFVDFTHRHDVFNITETFYCDFNEHYSARNAVEGQDYEVFPPEAVTFNSWCISPRKDKKGEFGIEQQQYQSPLAEREALSLKEKEKEEDLKPTSRFDILFSTLDVSVICYDVDVQEIGIDVVVYEESGDVTPGSTSKLPHMQVARRKISDKRLVKRPDKNGLLQQLGKQFENVLNLKGGTNGDLNGGEKADIQIARFVPEKGLLVKGIVHNDYWFCVEWLDQYLTFHTSWSPEGGGAEISGILILDFHPPW